MNKFLLFLFVSLFSFSLKAQDIHLSQFYTSDHLLNPAKVGDFEGDYRFIGNFRNQWRQINKDPLNTFIVSYDRAIRYYSHEIDGGILLARDEFTGFNTITSKIILSLGYGYTINGHNFRFGLQPGITFRSTDLSKQTFPNQWNYDPSGNGTGPVGFFDPNVDPKENSSFRDSQNFFDLNTGVQWSKRFRKLQPKFGLGLNHINRPKDTFLGDNYLERLRVRKVFYSELDYYLNKNITLEPKLLWMWTTNANDMLFGSNFKFGTGNKNIHTVFFGIFYRSGIKRNVDALFPVVGFSYKKFDFGFSYDVNVSTLSADVKRAKTFEFSIIYTGAHSKPKFIPLPCDRY